MVDEFPEPVVEIKECELGSPGLRDQGGVDLQGKQVVPLRDVDIRQVNETYFRRRRPETECVRHLMNGLLTPVQDQVV
jgi:hypothetical protein